MSELIPVAKIIPNPRQPRRTFNQVELNELAASIKANGLIQPIIVEKSEDRYILIDGERRWRATKIAGGEYIKAEIRESSNGSGDRDRLLLALIANLQRADLSPIEEARGYEELFQTGMSNAAIAHELGVSGHRVVSRRSILELDEEIQDLIAEGLLPIDQRVVVALKSIPGEHQVAFARKLARPGLKIRAVQRSVERFLAALDAERITSEPGLYFASRKAGKLNRPRWDALHQLGQVPEWSKVVEAANYTCETCELRAEASQVICGRCPSVALLAKLIEIADER